MNYQDLETLFWFACTIVVLTTTEPFQWVHSKIFNKLRGNLIVSFFYKMTQCQLCIGFWTGLIYSLATSIDPAGAIIFASALGFSSEVLRKLMWR